MKNLLTLLIISFLGFSALTYANPVVDKPMAEMQQPPVININSADSEMLSTLPGIGKKKAQAIVDYRAENGEFTELSDLANVKGIGKKLVAKLEGKVSL
ncbi:competence protein [Pseudoalteromonas sp. S3776]|uniref:ComEA family DNA-binding protein n=1 Tax=Pseudoalteromonas undina TaxID=43660 RepID=A0ACC6R113_9GAMM|nr:MULTISPECIES: ComEA family DNA-binding protein [unclassified Pseudoalteromonas]KPZ57765.1 ComE operon protein 1 [Pseudoalteromonas sp. P1-25]KPZ60275.1 ComE operon protein 1 [Pseudoalteromonas sp. P1-13-1a]KPZ62514.1 ComE operon protein 1 [Pseudoalteromonas sp. P1-7a]TMO77032.1 competence protein [Pseudoalteromonas sp. S3785]TMO81307.1 competence protein [Pseudoalteromonas sp. S3776]